MLETCERDGRHPTQDRVKPSLCDVYDNSVMFLVIKSKKQEISPHTSPPVDILTPLMESFRIFKEI